MTDPDKPTPEPPPPDEELFPNHRNPIRDRLERLERRRPKRPRPEKPPGEKT